MSEHEVEAVGTTTVTVGSFGTAGVEPGQTLHIYGTSEPLPARGSRLVTLIETKTLERGKGTDKNMKRLVTEYWSLDGKLLAEADKFAGNTLEGLEEEVEHLEERLKAAHEGIAKLQGESFEWKKKFQEASAQAAKLAEQVTLLENDGKPKKVRRGKAKR